MARADKSQDHSRALTSLHIARSKELEAASGRWRKIRANLILVSRQGFEEHKIELLGGHSQEQQCHRQAPIDDDYHHYYYFYYYCL